MILGRGFGQRNERIPKPRNRRRGQYKKTRTLESFAEKNMADSEDIVRKRSAYLLRNPWKKILKKLSKGV